LYLSCFSAIPYSTEDSTFLVALLIALVVLYKKFFINLLIIMVKVKAICRNEKEHVKQTNNELQRVQRNPTDATMHPF
jgi:hypothetical protein